MAGTSGTRATILTKAPQRNGELEKQGSSSNRCTTYALVALNQNWFTRAITHPMHMSGIPTRSPQLGPCGKCQGNQVHGHHRPKVHPTVLKDRAPPLVLWVAKQLGGGVSRHHERGAYRRGNESQSPGDHRHSWTSPGPIAKTPIDLSIGAHSPRISPVRTVLIAEGKNAGTQARACTAKQMVHSVQQRSPARQRGKRTLLPRPLKI